MTLTRQGNIFVDAIIGLTGNAKLQSAAEQDWCSATFAGQRIEMAIRFDKNMAHEEMDQIETMLCEHEFDFHSFFVADICVHKNTQEKDKTELIIEALLLRE